jgi:hypothetical protein
VVPCCHGDGRGGRASLPFSSAWPPFPAAMQVRTGERSYPFRGGLRSSVELTRAAFVDGPAGVASQCYRLQVTAIKDSACGILQFSEFAAYDTSGTYISLTASSSELTLAREQGAGMELIGQPSTRNSQRPPSPRSMNAYPEALESADHA